MASLEGRVALVTRAADACASDAFALKFRLYAPGWLPAIAKEQRFLF